MNNNVRKNIKYLLKSVLFIFLEVIIFFIITNYLDLSIATSLRTSFILILSISIINMVLWPVLSYISLRFLVLTAGLGAFLIDGILLRLLSPIPEVTLTGWAIFTVPLLIGVINSALSILLGMDNEGYYQLVLRIARGRRGSGSDKKTGFIFLEIDGLAHDVLVEAIDKGFMPTLEEWMKNKTHTLTKWETDLSSQTGSSQAGILHGNNSDIPAFRWVEKDHKNKIVTVNGFGDSKDIEKRISNGHGLLSNHGASRSNLFSGDADDLILTFSRMRSLGSIGQSSWYAIYSSPFFIARVMVLFLYDMIMEFISRIVHIWRDINPRLRNRGLMYFISRAGANIYMRESSTYSIIGDVYSGEFNTIYTTYMGYDEIAHHSGIRDDDAFRALRSIDAQFDRIQTAIESADRNYEITILSDHGQSNGPTFKMKYGKTLEKVVKENLPKDIEVHAILHSNDDHFLQQFGPYKYTKNGRERLSKELSNIRKDIDERTHEFEESRDNILTNNIPVSERIDDIFDRVGIDSEYTDEIINLKKAQTIVLASGNLGEIYFTDWSERLTYEQIEDAFPGLIKALANHPGIGFVMVNSNLYGTLVFNDDSIYYMKEDRYDGEPFLDKFGEHIVDHLKRTDGFKYVPDILVNSTYDLENDEVYAFEELIGSHGGAGGPQHEPFIFYPSSWKLDEKIVGAQNVYKFFMENMDRELENEKKSKDEESKDQ